MAKFETDPRDTIDEYLSNLPAKQRNDANIALTLNDMLNVPKTFDIMRFK